MKTQEAYHPVHGMFYSGDIGEGGAGQGKGYPVPALVLTRKAWYGRVGGCVGAGQVGVPCPGAGQGVGAGRGYPVLILAKGRWSWLGYSPPPYPRGQTHTYENSTFPHPLDAGGKNSSSY